MQLVSLSITNWRNFDSARLECGDGVHVLFGRNGVGKTNLLEAIFTLCLGRSQKGAPDTVVVRSGETVYRLVGELETDDGRHELTVAYQRGVQKKVTFDGVPIRLADLYSRFCAVTAGPEDSEILAGSPGKRRLFLDLYLSQLSPKYLADLTSYQRAVQQKNSALKQKMDCQPFDDLLISHGSRICAARQAFCATVAERAPERYRRIANGESMALSYEPTFSITPDMSSEEVADSFSQRLEEFRQKEAIVETAMIGPHRDDIAFSIADYPARTHGSQGQLRTAAISLKLTLYHLLREQRQITPLLLLDEIFAELDDDRATVLMEEFGGFDQLFLTTATEPPSVLGNRARRYRIEPGQIASEVAA